jgi:hypothetical protein
MMVSTVTASTVSVLTSTQITGSLAIIAIMILLAVLVQKEIARDLTQNLQKQFNQVLDVSVVPLLVAFFLIVFFNITIVLN